MPFYVRAKMAQAEVKAKFGEVKFLSRAGQPSDETAFITEKMTENELMQRLGEADVLNIIKVTDY